jgi:hypothetical protein
MEPRVPEPFDRQAGEPVEQRAAEQQEAEPPVPGGVEAVAGQHQEQLARVQPMAQRPADEEHAQEEQQEIDGREQHGRLRSSVFRPTCLQAARPS